MNLLPQQEIRALRKEVVLRVIASACFMIVLLEFVAVLLLVPSYVMVREQRNVLFGNVDQLKMTISGKGGAEDELRSLAEGIHSFMDGDGAQKIQSTEMIKEVLTVRPAGVKSSSLSIVRAEGGGVIQTAGVGATRESLLEYQKALRGLDFVKDARYAESFITKKVDIHYNLVITLK